MRGTTRHESLISGDLPVASLVPQRFLCRFPTLLFFVLPVCLTLGLIGTSIRAATPSCAGANDARTAGSLRPALVAELVGPVVIDSRNQYSENSLIRLTLRFPAGHNRAGELFCGYRAPVRIEEWRTSVYDGRFGASRLPMTVDLSQGVAEFTLKSLARYPSIDMRKAPVPQIAIFLGGRHQLLDVPQWVDQDGDEKIDWLEARVDDILGRARDSRVPELRSVIRSISGWKQSYLMDCGYFRDEDPTFAYVSPVCLDWDGENRHRLNTRQELTATVLHEARHVWVHRNHVRLDASLTRPGVANRRMSCAQDTAGRMCMGHIQDERYAIPEADAEAFAHRYKHLYP
jgi:hypothetical protein